MSDDLTITLRGQESYDYLQWRAAQLRPKYNFEDIAIKDAPNSDFVENYIKLNMQSIHERNKPDDGGLSSIIPMNCNACEHYRKGCLRCNVGNEQYQQNICPQFTPSEKPSSPF